MIFRLFLLIFIISSLHANDHKYKFGITKECVFHIVEFLDKKRSIVGFWQNCNGFFPKDKSIFATMDAVGVGYGMYYNEVNSTFNAYVATGVGIGDAQIDDYNDNKISLTYGEIGLIAGIEWVAYKGALFNVGAIYHYYEKLSQKKHFSPANKKSLNIPNNEDSLDLYLLFGIYF